jgi:hypothetical protein
MEAVLIRTNCGKRLGPLQCVEVYPGAKQVVLCALLQELVHSLVDKVHVLVVACVIAQHVKLEREAAYLSGRYRIDLRIGLIVSP